MSLHQLYICPAFWGVRLFFFFCFFFGTPNHTFGTPNHTSVMNKKNSFGKYLIMCWYFPWVNRWMGQLWLADWHYSCCSSWYSGVLCMINLTVSLSEESASSLPAGRPLRDLQLSWWSASHPLSPDVNPIGSPPLCTGTVAWRGAAPVGWKKNGY